MPYVHEGRGLRTMWELRREASALKELERLYPHYTNVCLACRFRTKRRVMDKFGESFFKTEKHQREEARRSRFVRECKRLKKPVPPRKCPFADIISYEYTFPRQENCYFAAEMGDAG